jgi:cysteine-rich repeat protein
MLLISKPPAGGSQLGIDFIMLYGQKVALSGIDCQTSSWSCKGGCVHIGDAQMQAMVQTERVEGNETGSWSCQVKQKDINGCNPAVCAPQKVAVPPAGAWDSGSSKQEKESKKKKAKQGKEKVKKDNGKKGKEDQGIVPSAASTDVPTDVPSIAPSTAAPSAAPTGSPTVAPSEAPTGSPTTFTPTKVGETFTPSQVPTTFGPSSVPTGAPSTAPTEQPSTAPTEQPSTAPSTQAPSAAPTELPHELPSEPLSNATDDGVPLITNEDAAAPATLDAAEPTYDQQSRPGEVEPSTAEEAGQMSQHLESVSDTTVNTPARAPSESALFVGGTCGDGRRSISEACDDGNDQNGDGCDADCAVEPGWSCWTGQSKSGCWRKKQFEAMLMALTVRGHHRCLQQRMPGFLLQDPTTGAGKCTAIGPEHLPDGFNSVHYGHGGGLAQFDTIYSRVTAAVTRPTQMKLHANARSDSGLPYAVCRSTRVSACSTTSNANATHCAWAGSTECLEVCLPPEYCGSSDLHPGELLMRNHSELKGKVCVFRGCKVPASWTLSDEGRSLQPSQWCSAMAERGADGDDIKPRPSITILLSEEQGEIGSDLPDSAAADPAQIRSEAQQAAKHANVLMSKWDAIHSDQQQLSRAEAEYWASEAQSEAGNQPGGIAGMAPWEIARALTAGAVEQAQMAHRESKKLAQKGNRLTKLSLMLKAAEKKWRNKEKIKVAALKNQLESDVHHEAAIKAEKEDANSTKATANATEMSLQQVEASSYKRHKKWMKMTRKQKEQLEELNQKATDSVAAAEQEIAKMGNKKSASQIAILRMLEKSKADQAAFGQLLKKAKAVEQAEIIKLNHLKSANAEKEQQVAHKKLESGEMLAAQKKHAAALEEAVAAKAQLAASAELKLRKAQEVVTIAQETAEEKTDLNAISQAQEKIQHQIEASTNGASTAKANGEKALAAEIAAREQSIEKHSQKLAKELSTKEASWDARLTSQLKHIQARTDFEQRKLNETKKLTDAAHMELQQLEITCTAQLEQTPDQQRNLIEQILAEDRKQAALLRGATIDQMESQVDAAGTKQAEQMQVLNKLHAQLAAAQQVMTKQKATYDILQRQLGIDKKAQRPCELSGWSSWGTCSAECDRGIQKRKRHVVQSGVGCSELPLSGERHCMIKECELCGDRRKVGAEECDDGNINDGDGCNHKCELEAGWNCDSSGCAKCGDGVISGIEQCESPTGCTDCKLNPGFTWVGGVGALSVLPTDQWLEDMKKQLHEGVTQCTKESDPSYWKVAEPRSGQGQCAHAPSAVKGQAESALDTSIKLAWAGGASAAAQGGVLLSANFANQLEHPKLDSAFALCKVSRTQLCAMEFSETMPRPSRRCISQGSYDCVEVNVDASYCDTQEGKDLGAVKTSRPYRSRTDSNGQVCIFEACNVPSSWHLLGQSNASAIQPSAWCFDVGASSGVLHYLV